MLLETSDSVWLKSVSFPIVPTLIRLDSDKSGLFGFGEVLVKWIQLGFPTIKKDAFNKVA
jgi:hypothetical protein